MRKWISCKEKLPKERQEGIGTVSDMVEVLLDTGEKDEDWLINHKWVLHCKLDSGGYPVKWRKKSGECTGTDEA